MQRLERALDEAHDFTEDGQKPDLSAKARGRSCDRGQTLHSHPETRGDTIKAAKLQPRDPGDPIVDASAARSGGKQRRSVRLVEANGRLTTNYSRFYLSSTLIRYEGLVTTSKKSNYIPS